MKWLDSDILVRPFIATPPAMPQCTHIQGTALALMKFLRITQQQHQLLLLPVT